MVKFDIVNQHVLVVNLCAHSSNVFVFLRSVCTDSYVYLHTWTSFQEFYRWNKLSKDSIEISHFVSYSWTSLTPFLCFSVLCNSFSNKTIQTKQYLQMHLCFDSAPPSVFFGCGYQPRCLSVLSLVPIIPLFFLKLHSALNKLSDASNKDLLSDCSLSLFASSS